MPEGKVCGSAVWFKVVQGVQQGCVLGPTMLIILLEFCKRIEGLKSLGIKFACVKKKQISLPADLAEATLQMESGEYSDDMALIDTSLSNALSKL
jgi:hypothetical protein